MTYQEMQQAEAEYQLAITPAKPRQQRGATKAQLEYRAKMFGPVAREIAEYDAEVYKAARDARVAKKLRQAMEARR
jgi:hypothetical protein